MLHLDKTILLTYREYNLTHGLMQWICAQRVTDRILVEFEFINFL